MRSLTFKLTLAFLLVSLTGIALVAMLVWGITYSEFNRFVVDRGLNEFTNAVATYYKTNGSWDGVRDSLVEKGLLPSQAQMDAQMQAQQAEQDRMREQTPVLSQAQAQVMNQPSDRNPPPIPFGLASADGKVIIEAEPFFRGKQQVSDGKQQKVAITVDGELVGYVIKVTSSPELNPVESRYLGRMTQALILASLGAVVIAVLLGLFLARTITRPVRELTAASVAMAEGHLSQQVQVRSRDELGELTKTFNKMSADLEQANRLRRQMTADIAHDLRTPLSVITGYLEGLKDGVVKPTPQRFTAMHDEAIFLQRLVEDLRILSLADAGELSINYQAVQPGELIERLASAYQHQAEKKNIHLNISVEPNLPLIKADPERVLQALSNLVSNAMRYTPEDGEITLIAGRDNAHVFLKVKDSGTGIPSDTLPHVFERFYRGDNSRQDEGSGLGLAIAKSIVELQGGKISVSSEGANMGSLFTIQLPCMG